ncbi:MAG: HesA/MoeB/ThiF family protein [Myxococcota bacterium]
MKFSEEQIKRYSRQILLKEVGGIGQKRLLESKVLVIGAGGLGSVLLMYLAGSGVGRIGVVEDDRVDLSNLPRQIIYTTEDTNKSKSLVVQDRIKSMNPEIQIETYNLRLKGETAGNLFDGYDLIFDCTDNFESRFLINMLAVKQNRPLISGSVVRFEGNMMLIIPHKTFCYNCIFDRPEDEADIITCSNSGVLGSVAGTIATLMVTEGIKFLLNLPTTENYLITYDALKCEFRKIRINRDPTCSVCSGY